MAELKFVVRTEYNEALHLRDELGRLRQEIQKVDSSTTDGAIKLDKLTKSYEENAKKLQTLVEKAANVAKYQTYGFREQEGRVASFIKRIGDSEKAVENVFAAVREQAKATTDALNIAHAQMESQIEGYLSQIDELSARRNEALAKNETTYAQLIQGDIDKLRDQISLRQEKIQEIEEEMRLTKGMVGVINESIDAYEKQAQSLKETSGQDRVNTLREMDSALQETVEHAEYLSEIAKKAGEYGEEATDKVNEGIRLTQYEIESAGNALSATYDLVTGKTRSFQSRVNATRKILQGVDDLTKAYRRSLKLSAMEADSLGVAMGRLNSTTLRLSRALIRAGVSAKTLKIALTTLKGIGVAAVLSVVGFGISAIIKKIKEAKQAAEEAKQAQRDFMDGISKAAAPNIAKFQQLREEYSRLGNEMSKKKFIEDNKSALESLGLAINNVNDAQKIFIDKAGDYVKAQVAYAEADAYRALMQQKITEALTLQQEIEKNGDTEETRRVSALERAKIDQREKGYYRHPDGSNMTEAEIRQYLFNPNEQVSVTRKKSAWLADENKEIEEFSRKAILAQAKGNSLLGIDTFIGPKPQTTIKQDAAKALQEYKAAKKELDKIIKAPGKYTQAERNARQAEVNKWAKAYEDATGYSPDDMSKAAKQAKEDAEKVAKERASAYKKAIDSLKKQRMSEEESLADATIASIENETARTLAAIDAAAIRGRAKLEEYGNVMNDLFKGNVDLTHRPRISSTKLADKGWGGVGPSAGEIMDLEIQISNLKQELANAPDLTELVGPELAKWEALSNQIEILESKLHELMEEREEMSKPENYATLFSSDYEYEDNKGKKHRILVTPILDDGKGTVFSKEELENYLDTTIKGAEDFLAADTLGVVIAVDVDNDAGEKLHEMQEEYYGLMDAQEKVSEQTKKNTIDRLIKELNKSAEARGKAIDEEVEAEEEERNNEFLAQYGDYEQKRLAIHLKWLGKIEAADEDHAKVYRKMFAEELLQLELKESGSLKMLFGDVSRYTQLQLEEARQALEKFKNSDAYKELLDDPEKLAAISEAENKLIQAELNEPFRAGVANLENLLRDYAKLEAIAKQMGDAQLKGNTRQALELEKEYERLRKQYDLDKTATVVDEVGKGLNYTADAITRIAEITGDQRLKDGADMLNRMVSTTTSILTQIATGNYAGAATSAVAFLADELTNEIFGYMQSVKAMTDYTNDFTHALKLLASMVKESDFQNIFGTNTSGLLQAYGKAGSEAMKNYMAAMGNGYNSLQEMMVTIEKRGFFRTLLTGGDMYKTEKLKDLAPEIFGEDGLLNVDKAKAFLNTNKMITEEQRKQINQAIELKEAYDDAEASIKSMLSSIMGSTASDLADATIQGLRTGATLGGEEMKRILGGTAKSLQKQLVESIYAKAMQKYSDQMLDKIMGGGNETDVLKIYTNMLNEISSTVAVATNAASRFDDIANAMGWNMGELANADTGAKAYSTISESTGSSIDGRMASIQIEQGIISGNLSQMLEQSRVRNNWAESIHSILTESYLEIVKIRKNTDVNLLSVQEIERLVTNIEKNTKNL